MNILSKIADIAGGSIFGKVADLVEKYLPPDMSPDKKAEFQLKLDDLAHEKEKFIEEVFNDSVKELNRRIEAQEGTASDLKSMPVIGRLVLFLRGLQRPAWGFFTMYLDYHWFTAVTDYTEQQQTALITVNILVLGFLFGERTIKNLTPLIIKVFGKT